MVLLSCDDDDSYKVEFMTHYHQPKKVIARYRPPLIILGRTILTFFYSLSSRDP